MAKAPRQPTDQNSRVKAPWFRHHHMLPSSTAKAPPPPTDQNFKAKAP